MLAGGGGVDTGDSGSVSECELSTGTDGVLDGDSKIFSVANVCAVSLLDGNGNIFAGGGRIFSKIRRVESGGGGGGEVEGGFSCDGDGDELVSQVTVDFAPHVDNGCACGREAFIGSGGSSLLDGEVDNALRLLINEGNITRGGEVGIPLGEVS